VSKEINTALGRPASTYYHAGIENPTQRERHQAAWSRGKVPIMCATIAFGE
jgi:superfamily II DNA helicase RecQ